VFCIKGEVESGGIKPQQFIEWKPDEPLPDGGIQGITPLTGEDAKLEYARLREKQRMTFAKRKNT
jgi:hypothetical protein